MHANNKESSLVRAMTHLCRCVGAIGAFYLAPFATRHFRLQMHQYLFDEFGYDIAHYGSWVFVGMMVLAAYFGIATLLQLLIHALIRLGARRAVF